MNLINNIKKLTRRKLREGKYYADELYHACKVYLVIDKDAKVKYELSVVDDSAIVRLGEDNCFYEVLTGEKIDEIDHVEIKEKVKDLEHNKVNNEFIIYPSKIVCTINGDHYGILTKDDIANRNYNIDYVGVNKNEYCKRTRR